MLCTKEKTRKNKIEYRILGQDWLLANSVFDISLVVEQAISWLTSKQFHTVLCLKMWHFNSQLHDFLQAKL